MVDNIQINIINYLEYDTDNKIKILFCKSDTPDYNIELPLHSNLIELTSTIQQFDYHSACVKITHCGIISEYLFSLEDRIVLDCLNVTIEQGYHVPKVKINNLSSIHHISYYDGCGYAYLFKSLVKLIYG